MTNIRRTNEAATDALVVRAKTEREALGSLYDRFFPLVHRYCQRRLFDRGAAEDVSSEVFLQVARAICRFPGTTEEDFRRWVYRIATNAINAHLRQQNRRGELLDHAVQLGTWTKIEVIPEPRDVFEGDWEAVARALAQLNDREQTVLTLRFMEGLSYEEMADVLGMRAATLRVVASRAIENLRRQLPKDFRSSAARHRERPSHEA